MDEIKIFKALAYLLIIVIIAMCNKGKDDTPPVWLDMNESEYPLDYNKTLKAKRDESLRQIHHLYTRDSAEQSNFHKPKNLNTPDTSDSSMLFLITIRHLSTHATRTINPH